MKLKLSGLVLAVCVLLAGCRKENPANIVATTAPVYTFTSELCRGTGLTVSQLVTESVSCLHDYTLKVEQSKAAEAAEVIVVSGAGLEDFLEGIIDTDAAIDASAGIELLCEKEEAESHPHEHEAHHHEEDPHIWLNPGNARIMAQNICTGLIERYPQYEALFQRNLDDLNRQLDALAKSAQRDLNSLKTRQLITFHDGFAYFANAFNLEILASVEEESGSEASAMDLISLITLVRSHALSAVFTEANGSASAAEVIARETGCGIRTLDMAMTGNYFEAMYANIACIKEALG